MCFWSENHQIMFHSDEYLAGQLFHDRTFTNISEPGSWHVEKARPGSCDGSTSKHEPALRNGIQTSTTTRT